MISMHVKNIIAYRHMNRWQKRKVLFTPRETLRKNNLSTVDFNLRETMHFDLESISN